MLSFYHLGDEISGRSVGFEEVVFNVESGVAGVGGGDRLMVFGGMGDIRQSFTLRVTTSGEG